jgi:hypothetical protein
VITGQHLRHWLKVVFQWLGGQLWQMLVLTFWLTIQILELLIWLIAELKARIKSALTAIKREIKQKKLKLFLWPFQVILRAAWEILVQGVWLLVQLIELIFWCVEIWQKSGKTQNPDIQDNEPKNKRLSVKK